ncbi:hypothetical protein C2E23DRAFT_818711, partial [Lenzites betulinus]
VDTLPLETLEHIFELACVDGGYTGCSLSLTSRARVIFAVAATLLPTPQTAIKQLWTYMGHHRRVVQPMGNML